MYALITDGSIAKHLSGNRGIQIGDIKYARDIYSKWTEAERNAIGIFEIIFNNTKKKEEEYYFNTTQTYTYDADAGTVTATYGDATAKASAGIKTEKIKVIKQEAAGILQDTDWYIIRKADADTDVPSAITTFRAAVRTKAAAMETLVTNASNTAAIQTLYTYVNTADEGDPVVMERPLGEFPVLGS